MGASGVGARGDGLPSAPSLACGDFRRLVVRYEQLMTTSAGFFHLTCALLTLRRVLK